MARERARTSQRQAVIRASAAVALVLFALGLPALASVASAATATVAVVPSPNVSIGTPPAPTTNQLTAVAAASAQSVWAVGSYNSGTAAAPLDQTLIEHFDGSSWTVVPSPNQLNVVGAATENELLAVSADSPTDAWAVGYYVDLNAGGYPVDQLLVEHYNGTSWSLPSTAPPMNVNGPRASQNHFLGVEALSPTDVWATGEYHNGSSPTSLIEQFNGTSWSQATSINPGSSANVLQSITTDGAGNLYAAGYQASSGVNQTLIEQYNGTAWSVATSPDTSATVANQLTGISADSVTDAWAAGSFTGGTVAAPVNQTLIEHYNGTTWSLVASPDSGATVANQLTGISADSATDVWAVGSSTGGTVAAPINQTLIEHYDGTTWSVVTSPNAGTSVANQLAGAVAISPTDLWTVGSYTGGTVAAPVNQTLIEGTPPASTTKVTSSPASPVVGQSVTYTATVSGPASAVPVGTATFADGGVAIAGCSAVPLSSGAATCTTVVLGAGSHTISAAYSGDDVHLASTGTLALTVSQASTTTTLSTPFSSVFIGQPVTLTATVATTAPGSGVPSGVVGFTVGGTSIVACVAQVVAAGAAQCTYTPTTVGSSSFDAVYGGSTDYLGSTAAPLSVTVISGATTTAVTSTANPSSAGQALVFAAVVSPVAPATGTPAGTVTFDNGATPIAGCIALAMSSAAAVCPTAMPMAGTFPITATYSGSANFAASVSPVLSQVVQAGLLTVQDVQAAGNPSASGVTLSPVTLGSALANPSAVSVTFSNDQFAQAVGTLNSVSVNDGRGTEPGWTVTAQLEGNFTNAVPVGPAEANVIPANFLTWAPAPVTGAAGESLSGIAAGPPATLSTTTPTALCDAAAGSGGGSYSCSALLSLAVPPYVAAGSYGATMVIITS
jgi:hypothetical protein